MNSTYRSCFAALAVSLGIAGCSSSAQKAPAVNPARAREALRTTLDCWKNGGTPDQLKNGPAAITAQDFDWMAGVKLVGYEVAGEGKYDDANLRIPVELTLRDPAGKEVKKRVSYVVGTAPALTVFREMFSM